MPSRYTALHDILTNSLGGGVGFLVFQSHGDRLVRFVETRIAQARKRLRPWSGGSLSRLCFIGCLGIAAVFTALLQRSADFKNWDGSCRIVLGNEAIGLRDWYGQMFEVQISGSALSATEASRVRSHRKFRLNEPLLFSARWTKSGSFEDEIGLVPPLAWQKGLPSGTYGAGSRRFGDGHWLRTEKPATRLADATRKLNQITIYARAATASAHQQGPARLVSFSKDPLHRNFTLGQQGTDLVYRLRTRVTNDNGYPQLVIPGVFATHETQDIIFTYDGSRSRVFVNGVEQSPQIEHNPGVILFAKLYGRRGEYYFEDLKILYYGPVFGTLGVLLLFTKSHRAPLLSVKTFIGIVTPSLVVEGLVVYASGKFWNDGNVLLGCVLTFGGYALTAYAFRTTSAPAETSPT